MAAHSCASQDCAGIKAIPLPASPPYLRGIAGNKQFASNTSGPREHLLYQDLGLTPEVASKNSA